MSFRVLLISRRWKNQNVEIYWLSLKGIQYSHLSLPEFACLELLIFVGTSLFTNEGTDIYFITMNVYKELRFF